MGTDDLLDHEGRIRAQHQQLAMRHVDHTHDAERDGQARRGQEQDRAERQAVEQRLAVAEQLLPELDLADCRGDGRGDGGAGRGRRGDDAPGLSVAAVTQRGDGGQGRVVRTRRGQGDGGAGLLHRAADVRVLFGVDRAVEGGAVGRVAGVEHGFGGGGAQGRVGREQAQRPDRGVDGAADIIVEPDGPGGCGGRGAAGCGIGHGIAVPDQHVAFRGHHEITVLHGLQDRQRARIAGCAERLNPALNFSVASAGEWLQVRGSPC